eukprot:3357436-Amphidinium_carterae.1
MPAPPLAPERAAGGMNGCKFRAGETGAKRATHTKVHYMCFITFGDDQVFFSAVLLNLLNSVAILGSVDEPEVP